MGADFTYELLPAAEITPERKIEMKHLIDTLSKDDMEQTVYADRFGPQWDKCIQDIHRDFEEYCNFSSDRDVAELSISPDEDYYISGGMSWGDHPTDACQTMYKLNSLPLVYKQLDEWAYEDKQNYKKRAKKSLEESKTT